MRIKQAADRHARASEALATERTAAEASEATAKLPRWEVVLIQFRASIPEPIRMLGRGLLWIVNFLVAIAEKGGKIAVLVLAALFLLPSLYGTAVRWMPHSYYLVGALGQPPGFDDLPAWNIDLPGRYQRKLPAPRTRYSFASRSCAPTRRRQVHSGAHQPL